MADLMWCPFCGGVAHAINNGGWRVMCRRCSCQTGLFGLRENAKAAWNRRNAGSANGVPWKTTTATFDTEPPKVEQPKVEQPKDDFYYGADDRERMQMCLTCEKPKCNNCLERVPHPEGLRKKRSRKE